VEVSSGSPEPSNLPKGFHIFFFSGVIRGDSALGYLDLLE